MTNPRDGEGSDRFGIPGSNVFPTEIPQAKAGEPLYPNNGPSLVKRTWKVHEDGVARILSDEEAAREGLPLTEKPMGTVGEDVFSVWLHDCVTKYECQSFSGEQMDAMIEATKKAHPQIFIHSPQQTSASGPLVEYKGSTPCPADIVDLFNRAAKADWEKFRTALRGWLEYVLKRPIGPLGAYVAATPEAPDGFIASFFAHPATEEDVGSRYEASTHDWNRLRTTLEGIAR